MPFIEEKRIISHLGLGCTLNEYRHKIEIQDSPDCSCGAIETVAHYTIDAFF